MFRATALEKKIIESKAKDAGMTTARYIRECALERRFTARLSPEEIEAYMNLVQLKSHFTRISNLIRDRKGIYSEVREVVDLVNNHLSKFQ